MNRVLICKKDKRNVKELYSLLSVEGFDVIEIEHPEKIQEFMNEKRAQLLVIDVEQKNRDGVQIIRDIRKNSAVPVLVFSENGSEEAKIAALNAGADDYVTLPCSLPELVARIKSQMFRYTQLVSMCENIHHIYRVDDLEINDVRRVVTVEGREVYLTPIEYKILRLLVRERGRVLSIDQIYESIWNMQAIGAENTIAVHIRHIREKIERNPRKPQYLKVVWGTGYKVG